MRYAMGLLVVLCIAPGLFPQLLYTLLDHPPEYQAYTAGHVIDSLQLLLAAAVVFFAALPWLQRKETITLDWDYFYRRLPGLLASLAERVSGFVWNVGRAGLGHAQTANIQNMIGRLGGRNTNNTLLLGLVVMLVCFLVFYFFSGETAGPDAIY